MSEAKQPTEIALLPPADRAVIALESTKAEAQIREIMAESSEVTVVTNKAGRDQAHRVAMKLKTARVTIEKLGKSARDDANAFSRAVISEEKRLKDIMAAEEARVFRLRDEYDEKIRREEEERAAQERARIDAIRSKIEALRGLPVASARDMSETIKLTISDLEALVFSSDEFHEFAVEACAVRESVLVELKGLLAAAEARELAEKQLAEERERLTQAKKEEEYRQEAERKRIEDERAELDRQRQEFERQRAEFERAKAITEGSAPQAEIVLSETVEPEVVTSEPVSVESVAVEPSDCQPEMMSEEESDLFISGLESMAAEQMEGLADKLDAVMHSQMAEDLRDLAEQIIHGAFRQQIMVADWNEMAVADRRMGVASRNSESMIVGEQEAQLAA